MTLHCISKIFNVYIGFNKKKDILLNFLDFI